MDITEYLTLSAIFPLLILSLHLSQSYLVGMPETVQRFIFNFILMLVFTSYFLWKLFIKLRRRENLRLGFDAERAVGQELNNLVSMGYKVFHDIPGEKFNIDHIVVGPTGVFCIETKGRPKSIDIDGNSEHEVTYDGEKLIFPKWIERKPIEQVIRNSDWLAKTLSRSINEEVKVVPALCISGWQIYRESKLKPFTFNGKNSEGLFIKMKGYELSPNTINKIVNQIELWIDDVETMAYKINS